ncbi:DNA glycosylase AlkZ-like family protein [Micromonospora sp. BQ11]
MAGNAPEMGRAEVLAYRAAVQELHRPPVRRPGDLAVLGLGVQDTPYGSARLALAARGVTNPDDDRLELVWSVRGAPHLHRRAALPALAAALWPLDDADAARRIGGQIGAGAALGLAAFEAAARAFTEVVTGPMAKGGVSRAVSDRVPTALTYDCGPCRARHISGSLFQQAGLAGGVRLEVSGRTTTLAPLAGWPGPPTAATGTTALARTVLRLLGPATPGDVAAFLGTSPTALRPVWPGDLAEVRVDGRRAWLPAEQLPALRAAEAPPGVRLLPPGDPFLQARDREVLVPEKAQRSQLWRMIGSPGAVLVDGDVAGTWRAKQAGRGVLDLTVSPFGRLPARARRSLDEEAAAVAAARGATETRVHVETG